MDYPKALQHRLLGPADPSLAALVASPKALQGQGSSRSMGRDSWARVGKVGGADPWASLYASKAGMHQVLLHMPSDYALLAVLQVVLLQAGAHCAELACCKGAAVGN